jgi:putative transposase
MIDRRHNLPISKQAEALNISRGSVHLTISMDGKGSRRDNVFLERLWRSIKYEEVYLQAYDSVAEARSCIGRYLDFYNTSVHIRALTAPRRIRPFTTLPLRAAA